MKQIITIIFLLGVLIMNSQETQDFSKEQKLWEDAGFENINISILPNKINYFNPPKFTHSMNLTIVSLRGAGWSKKSIHLRIKKAATIFGMRCGIRIEDAMYIEVDPPNGKLDIKSNLSSQKDGDDYKLANMAPTKKRPMIFFVRSNPAQGDTAFSWRLIASNAKPLQGTAFVTADVLSSEFVKITPTSASPTAHELAHLLCSCGHIEGKEPNILSDYKAIADSTITPKQCETFKKIGVETGILKKL